jgi:predicted homoserine dehydrogenase-like protein
LLSDLTGKNGLKGRSESGLIYHHLFEHRRKQESVSMGLIGTGHFGTAVITQSVDLPYLKVPIVADRNLDAARLAYQQAGIPNELVVVADTRQGALTAMEKGQYVIVQDPMLLMDLPLDVIAESTGIPEAGALHAFEAIRHGKHVAMINKETDSVVGPILNHMAQQAGLVYTPVDGDQHGLLMGLVAWARTIGLEVVAAGKARDGEFIHDRETGTVYIEADGITIHETASVKVDPKDAWALEPMEAGQAKKYVDARKEILASLPQAGGFDLCEMVIAANATGLVPDIPELHQPILRIPEIPEALCPRTEQGIFTHRGVMEAVTCFRYKHEAGMGGGVYIVVACKNDYSRMIINTKGQIPNSLGTTALIYRPYHLCGVETSISVMTAGLLGLSTGSEEYLPRFDMVQTATRDMTAEEILGDDHDLSLKASLIPAFRLSESSPLPAHLLNGKRLKRDIPAGTLITTDMVEIPADSSLWELRLEQDKVFLA